MSLSDSASREAFVTLATNDAYSVGALVLGQSLRAVHTTRQLVVMVTNQVSQATRDQLAQTFDHVVEVDVLDSGDIVNLDLLTRPDLGLTFTKLHCWRLTQFTKCVFMDADTLVLQNIDELFNYEELAAAPDVGWPDCFNSGVFVLRPSEETYTALLNFALTHGSFDGGDQGLLNLFFSDWSTQGANRRLPFIYNTVAQAFYSYAPAFKRFGQNVKVIHFIGAVKPWHVGFNTATRTLQGDTGEATEFVQRWWNIFMDRVHHHLSDFVKLSLAEKGPQATFGHPSDAAGHQTVSKHQLDDGQRQYNWERGQIDYMGVDSFENIQRQLDAKILPSPGDEKPGVNGTQAKVNGEPEVKATVAKNLGEAAPVQFDEDSEFRKRSIETLIRPAPKRSVHRTTLIIPRKVYNEQVKTLTGPAQGKTPAKPEPSTTPIKAQPEVKSSEIAVCPPFSCGTTTTTVTKEERRPVACSYTAPPDDQPPPYQFEDIAKHAQQITTGMESLHKTLSQAEEGLPGPAASTTKDVKGIAWPSGVEDTSSFTSSFQTSSTTISGQGITFSPEFQTGQFSAQFEGDDIRGRLPFSGTEGTAQYEGDDILGRPPFSDAESTAQYEGDDIRGRPPFSGTEGSGMYGIEAYPLSADTKSRQSSSTEAGSDGSFATGFESFSSPAVSKGDASSSGLETGGSATYCFESFSSSSTAGGHVSSPGGFDAGEFMTPQQPGFSLTSSSPVAPGYSPLGQAHIGHPDPDPSATKEFTIEASLSKSSVSTTSSAGPAVSQQSSHQEAPRDVLHDVPHSATPESPSSHGAAATTHKPSGQKKTSGKRGKK